MYHMPQAAKGHAGRRGSVDRASATQPQRAPRYILYAYLHTHGRLHAGSQRPPTGAWSARPQVETSAPQPGRAQRAPCIMFVALLLHPIGTAPSHPLEGRHAGSDAHSHASTNQPLPHRGQVN